MLKRIFIVCLLSLVSCVLVTGCSTQSSDTTTSTCVSTTSTTTTSASTSSTSTSSSTGSSTTSTTIASNVVVSGRLMSGAITGLGMGPLNLSNPNKVVAIDNQTDQTYIASCDAQGNFSLDLPSGVSYEISLVDDTSKYFGPVMMAGNASSSEVIMGMKSNADYNFGEIVFDPSRGLAKPTTEPTSLLNPTDLANATAGVPLGANTCGKDILCLATREGGDMDKDGIPNLFDADEDGDQVRNGILSRPTAAAVISNTVEAVFISSNIWSSRGDTLEAKDQIGMWLNVATPNDTALNQIGDIQVVDVPATIKDVATIRFSSSIGDPVGYPAENSLWKDSGHHLYKTTTLARNQWIVSLCPRANMNVGDIFTIRVTYADGAYQDFFLSTSYFMTDWPKILTCNGVVLPTTIGKNTTTEAAQFSTASLEVVISKAKDEDGNVLAGLGYSIIIGTVEAENPLSVAGPSGHEYRSYQYPDAFTDGLTTETIALQRLVTFEANSYYYITPVAEGNNQRNGEQVWFKKI